MRDKTGRRIMESSRLTDIACVPSFDPPLPNIYWLNYYCPMSTRRRDGACRQTDLVATKQAAGESCLSWLACFHPAPPLIGYAGGGREEGSPPFSTVRRKHNDPTNLTPSLESFWFWLARWLGITWSSIFRNLPYQIHLEDIGLNQIKTATINCIFMLLIPIENV